MIKFLINRPIAIFMVTLSFVVLGIVASFRIPTSLMPDVPIPEVTVQVSYANVTARELETNVVRPLRNQLLQVSKLKNITSETRDGLAILKLTFDYGTNTNLAFVEINEKIDASHNYLPKDLQRPKVIKASATDIPILNVMVSLKGDFSEEKFLELSDFTATVLKKRIEQLPDIAMADVSGLTKPKISVIPNQQKLQSLQIDNEQLVTAIKQNNFELGNLLIHNGIYQYNFRFLNPLRSKRDIENIYLKIKGKLFQLKELADVKLRSIEDRGMIYVNGRRAIVLSIVKQADARVYDLEASLEKLIQSFKNDYEDLIFDQNQNQTTLLKMSIDNLKSSLLIGSLLAIIIMFVFLGDVKLPLIIAFSIPISLIISILFMYLLGMSINIVSLSGLILGVGMMIDNSIIVIDNITQKLEMKNSLLESCAKGTNEIITPLLSSFLTTCSVFLPLLFLSGMIGALFYDQALSVSIGLFSSFLVSIFWIPVVYYQLKIRHFKIEKWIYFSTRMQYIENWYATGYNFFFKRKYIVYGGALFFTVLALILPFVMSYTQLPKINHNETVLRIDWNDNITVTENQRRVESLFQDIEGAETVFSQIGEQQFLLRSDNIQSFSETEVYIKTQTLDQIENIKSHIKKYITQQYPNTTYSFKEPKNIFQYVFGSDKHSLTAQINSKKIVELPNEEELSTIENLLQDFSSTETPLKQTAFIEIQHEKLLLYDVSYNALLDELKTVFNKNIVDNLRTFQESIPIELNYEMTDFDSLIDRVFVRNKSGELIAVRNLIRSYQTLQYKAIQSDKRGEFLKFDIDANDNISNKINQIRTVFQNSDYDVRFDGSYFDVKNLEKELIVVILVSVLLLYFIMATQFNSLWQPLVILLEIPIDIGASLLFLHLFGGTINVMSGIGLVVMSGIIVNDSILKLHTINLLRKEGKAIDEAIKLGGKMRLKPILMTSLTTILALFPFLFIDGLGAELQKPLAIVVIGGMVVGTFVSLYFIPMIYRILIKK
ncbi:efflux RND transporter permease subunit [Capnocytophaga canis]|uniref:RND transporter, HAE1/HME family, permease protein n=1 Tax=Capnocytophaga canis TaxID=1848903 RepID=A0A0B7ISG6_9FLAO|nr:efflux RND transporter permease subunit [Capnocytophaga canis]CEN53559.1 conserved membrane hypothetical protein [Capnocytophaga canis]